jgi:eukaryotic-like serine/threonine-protein kinase
LAPASRPLLAIVIGAGVAVWQLGVARDERARADEVKAFIASIFEQATPYGADGTNPTARDLLREAAGRIDGQFMNRPALRMELLLVVAGSLLQQQDLDGGEPLVDEAVRVGRAHLGDRHPMTLHARLLQAQLHRHRGRTDALAAELDTLVPAMRTTMVPDEQLVEALKLIAHLEIDRGRYAEAVPAAVEAEREALARLGEQHVETVAASLALTLSHVYTRKFDLAVAAGEQALRRARVAYHGNDRHPAVLDALSIYGRALAGGGDVARGIEVLSTARDHAAEVFGPNSLMVGFQTQNLVRYRLDIGDVAGALADSERAVTVLSAVAGSDLNAMASAHRAHGAALLAAHRFDEAAAALDRAVDAARQAVGESHDITLGIGLDRAAARVLAGGAKGAPAVQRDVASIREQLTPTRTAALRARGLHVQGLIDLARGRPDAAETSFTQALAVLTDGRPERLRMQMLAALGQSQLAQGRYTAAAESLAQAQALHADLDRHDTPDRRAVDDALRRARAAGRR